MFSLYDLFMRPLERRGIRKHRNQLIPQASGVVLEIGSGTGVNIKHYDFNAVKRLVVTDKRLSKVIRKQMHEPIELMEADVSNLPFPDQTFDTIVHTLVFCSVDDVAHGLAELKRVLKPGGKIIFIEHVLPEQAFTQKLFRLINPVWRVFASGCQLTKTYERSLEDNGFHIVSRQKFMNTVFVSGIAVVQT